MTLWGWGRVVIRITTYLRITTSSEHSAFIIPEIVDLLHKHGWLYNSVLYASIDLKLLN